MCVGAGVGKGDRQFVGQFVAIMRRRRKSMYHVYTCPKVACSLAQTKGGRCGHTANQAVRSPIDCSVALHHPLDPSFLQPQSVGSHAPCSPAHGTNMQLVLRWLKNSRYPCVGCMRCRLRTALHTLHTMFVRRTRKAYHPHRDKSSTAQTQHHQ